MHPRNNIPLKIAVFASGEGTNAEAILDHNFIADNKQKTRDVQIVALVCNHKDAAVVKKFETRQSTVPIGKSSVKKAFKGKVHVVERHYLQTREEYDAKLAQLIRSQYPDLDLIVLAGWMHVFSDKFLNSCGCPVINLHPALPGEFPGAHGMRDAWNAYQQGKISGSGIMIHHVDTGVDTGEVVLARQIPILETDDFERFQTRMQVEEKVVLVEAIKSILTSIQRIYIGKVRDLYILDGQSEMLLVRHSDRLSAFDTNVCTIPGKGAILSEMAAWWFKKTSDIVPNHYLYHSGENMVVRRCRPILLEIVVRGYLAGNSPTSIWTMYQQGNREMYGHTFPDGMTKNQRLATPIITPTTKGAHDHPITGDQVLKDGILSEEQWQYVSRIALELFERGTQLAADAGMILVDTKYEFGFLDGIIVLIDEIHTPDSSRFWLRQTYEANMLAGEEPTKLDKDQVREFLKENPLEKTVPETVVRKTLEAYSECYERLLGKPYEATTTAESFYQVFCRYLYHLSENIAVIISGSESDHEHVTAIREELAKFKVTSVVYYASAHKQADKLLSILKQFRGRRVVYITVAGLSNALSGFIAGNQPGSIVIACPPITNRLELQMDLNSSLMMPSNVPVMTVVGARNGAQAAVRILK